MAEKIIVKSNIPGMNRTQIDSKEWKKFYNKQLKEDMTDLKGFYKNQKVLVDKNQSTHKKLVKATINDEKTAIKLRDVNEKIRTVEGQLRDNYADNKLVVMMDKEEGLLPALKMLSQELRFERVGARLYGWGNEIMYGGFGGAVAFVAATRAQAMLMTQKILQTTPLSEVVLTIAAIGMFAAGVVGGIAKATGHYIGKREEREAKKEENRKKKEAKKEEKEKEKEAKEMKKEEDKKAKEEEKEKEKEAKEMKKEEDKKAKEEEKEKDNKAKEEENSKKKEVKKEEKENNNGETEKQIIELQERITKLETADSK